MLIRASGPLQPDFYLLTLGQTCRYILGDRKEFVLFDPGLSAHVPMLLKRIESFSLPLRSLTHVLMTHLHADRLAGVSLLRRQAPRLKLVGTAAMRAKLEEPGFIQYLYDEDRNLSKDFRVDGSSEPCSFEDFKACLTLDRIIADSDIIALANGLQVRAVSSPGHTSESLSFQVLPLNYLIVDEGFGYYRGREFAAPGGDWNQDLALASIRKLLKTEISALCLSNQGVLTGQLHRRHLEAILQNTADLFTECARAHEAHISDEEIFASLQKSFYMAEHGDPIVVHSLNNSLNAAWAEVLRRRNAAATN